MDSSVGVDQRGWGIGGGDGRGNVPRPATTVDPDAESILELFIRLGIEHQCVARMINIEQFMSSSYLISLDGSQIESICVVNRRGELRAKNYILVTGENNIKLAAFTMKHMKNTGRSCDPSSVYNPYVMLFKDNKRRVETHQRYQITAPVLTNRMFDN